MPCLQANSINWTPFYSMASKIDTSGSCPVGICKSLLQRIAQVVGLALDGLTLPIRLFISCLCPSSLKGKVKDMSNVEKKEASDEKKEVDSSSKEVEKKEADPEIKGGAEIVQPLEENKSEASASSSSKLEGDVEFLLGRAEAHDTLVEKQQYAAKLTRLAVGELLHLVEKVYYGRSQNESEGEYFKQVDQSFAKVQELLNITQSALNPEQSHIEGEAPSSEAEADHPLVLSDDDTESDVDEKKEISSDQNASVGENSAPVSKEANDEPAVLPPVSNDQVDPSLNAAPSNVPVADVVPPPDSEEKKAELPSLEKHEVLHLAPSLNVTHAKEDPSLEENEIKKEEEKHTLKRKLSNAALQAEGFVVKEVKKIGEAMHIGHASSKKNKEKGPQVSDSNLSERSSSKEERSSGKAGNDLLTPPTSPKSTDLTQKEDGYELVEIPVPPTPSPTKGETKAKDRPKSARAASSKALKFDQPLKAEISTKEGEESRREIKALAKAEKAAANAAKKAEEAAKKEAVVIAEKVEKAVENEVVEEFKKVF